MDAVWLILDSLSASATPFVDGGEETMPELSALASEHGVNFPNAYVPGPSSPSSHGSFFTGELPSTTGMHEARPYFDRTDIPTIAGALEGTHESFLISSNPFIFNGLQRDFDKTDDLRNEQYLLFNDASDPGRDDGRWDYDSTLRQGIAFLRHSEKPVRSLFNAISYKWWVKRQGASIPKHADIDTENYQYAETTNRRIRAFLESGREDKFVVANYMDVHPPLDASNEAIERFAPDADRDDLPIGVRGQDVYEAVRDGDETLGDRMYNLYLAAIWDLDRKLAPLVDSLIDAGTFVIVTADHGHWFKRTRELEEDRIHVPLLVFHPGHQPRTVSETVNLRVMPRTTMDVVRGSPEEFSGPSLLNVDEDQTSITEFIHVGDTDNPVRPGGCDDGPVQRDIVAVRGDTRIDAIDGQILVEREDSQTADELSVIVEELLDEPVYRGHTEISYDEKIDQRLRDLGYLE